MTKNTLEIRDNRSFFEKTLYLGVQKGKITREKVQEILSQGSNGIIQIAQVFSTPYLRPGLESARDRMVTLVSLYLENESQGNFDRAIDLINQREFFELSKGGSDMIKELGGIMKIDDLSSKEDNIKRAYALFSTIIPWNEGGILPKYQSRLREEVKVQKKLRFTRKLVKLAGIKNYDFTLDDIAHNVFLPVITGKELEAEYSETFQSGKYDTNKWTTLLAKLDGEFGEFCEEYNVQNCIGFLESIEQIMAQDQPKEQDIVNDEGSTQSEWNILFPKGNRHTTKQYITAALTGAINGEMKKSITLDEFIKICEKARKQKTSLSQLEEYISKNTQPSLDIYATIINRLDKDWRGMLEKKSPINRRTYELKFLIEDIDISAVPSN